MDTLNWLENAERELAQGELNSLKESLLEIEYNLYAKEQMSDIDREVLGLVKDCLDALKGDYYDHVQIFIMMAIDVITCTEVKGYEFNQVGTDTVSDEIDALQNTEIEDTQTAEVEWHFAMRKLEQKMIKLLVEDHNRRFSKV